MNNDIANETPRIHDADCDIWKVAEGSSPDALIAAGYRREDMVLYLSSISPIYAAFSRVLAQFSGILLLAMTDTRTVINLDRAMWLSAQDQLSEAQDRLHDVGVPADAKRHYDALVRTGIGLADTAINLDEIAAHRDPLQRKAQVNHLLTSLKRVQRMLIATAEPDANIAPVDFNGGCCSCRKPIGNS